MRIDSHQHFWNYDPAHYPWITDRLARIRKSFLPSDLEPLLDRHQLDGSVAVQAQQTVAEARWLLELADRHPRVLGVVGWVDLQSDRVDQQLAELSAHPKFVGVRHVVQDEPDDQFLLRPEFLRGVSKLASYELTYDILIYPHQLPATLEFVQRFPDLPMVLDHIAKPRIREQVLEPWKQQIQTLAKFPNVSCKVSGMVTEASWDQWKPADFRAYLDVIFSAFGEDRVMYGSDWPVCLLADEYERVFELVDNFTANFSSAARHKFFGANAADFYGIKNS